MIFVMDLIIFVMNAQIHKISGNVNHYSSTKAQGFQRSIKYQTCLKVTGVAHPNWSNFMIWEN
jgi:hypothetical protein